MPENRAAPLLALLILVAVAATAATWLDVRRRTADLSAELARLAEAEQRVERALHLFRLERGSKGLGVTALLEQLRYWAPLLELSTTPQRELPAVQQRVDDVLLAIEDIGRDAFDPLLAELQRAQPGKDDELIYWLLIAMSRVDQERGKDLLGKCARGIELAMSGRIRVQAARRLLEMDQPRAAALLAQIVQSETAAGVDIDRLPPELRAKVGKEGVPPMRMFFNFIDLLVAAAGSAAEDALMAAAARPDQDRMTVQTCVKHLGELKAKRAVKLLKKLYHNPPEMMVNPIFQNHCLDAIASIEGPAACDWFRELLGSKADERVLAKLQELIKNLCP